MKVLLYILCLFCLFNSFSMLEANESQMNLRIDQLLSQMPDGVAILSSGSFGKNSREFEDNYRTSSYFYYLTGLTEANIIAIFSNVHPTHHYILFWNEPTERQKIYMGMYKTPEDLRKEAGADAVYPLNEFENKLPEYLENASTLYYTMFLDENMDKIVLAQREKLLHYRSLSFSKQYPSRIEDLENILEDMRLCKDAEELKNIRQAIKITQQGLETVVKQIHSGMTEKEIEAILSYQYSILGARGVSFHTIVGSGSNATILHYEKNSGVLKDGDLVLIDTGAEYNYYCADVTRTIPVSGKFTPAQEELYNLVLEMQRKSIEAIYPGAEATAFNHAAIRVVSEFLHKKGLVQASTEEIIEKKLYLPFYPHGTGHWLGLDVHDVGCYYKNGKPLTLKPGMIITVEPGIYFSPMLQNIPQEYQGIGIRIEDDVLVTETGNEILTKDIPK